MEKLEALNLGTNLVAELPKEIGNLFSLKISELHCTQIRDTPEEFSRHKSLKHFGLTGTLFSEKEKVKELDHRMSTNKNKGYHSLHSFERAKFLE